MKARKKRMCISAMILCDALDIINYEKMTQIIFDEIKNVGDLYELELLNYYIYIY